MKKLLALISLFIVAVPAVSAHEVPPYDDATFLTTQTLTGNITSSMNTDYKLTDRIGVEFKIPASSKVAITVYKDKHVTTITSKESLVPKSEEGCKSMAQYVGYQQKSVATKVVITRTIQSVTTNAETNILYNHGASTDGICRVYYNFTALNDNMDYPKGEMGMTLTSLPPAKSKLKPQRLYGWTANLKSFINH